jgi:uncharacterized protein (TIRG00374 family)
MAAALGFAGSFLAIALRGVDWTEVGASFADADYRYVPAMAILGIYVLYVRSQRWRLLLQRAARTDVGMRPIFSANAIGFMANMLLPLRAGEIARPVLLSGRTGLALPTVLATAVMERILDLVVLVCFAMWVVWSSNVPPQVLKAAWGAGALMLIAIGGLVAVHFNRARLLPLVDRLWSILPPRLASRIRAVEHRFLDDLAVLGGGTVLLQALAWSFYLWLLIAIGFSLGFRITRLEVPFLSTGIVVMTLVALAVAAPAAPGFVGSFQFACKVALVEIAGTTAGAALGYSLITHATQFATQVVVGLVYLVRDGVSLSEIGRLGSGRQAEP